LPELRQKPRTPTSNDLLEQALINLWSRRLSNEDEALQALSRALIFRKMMVASPGMISAIRRVASLEIACPQEPPLPAVLIVAPPGSGKEMMSDLIPLFSDFFWKKPVAKLNMGSLNAPPLTPALLMGLEGQGGWFKGVFQKLAEGALAKGGTLVLDELNSLEIAAQPLLLRLLEQGDLSSLDNTMPPQDKTLPWLVIGLINEDPEQLTLEKLRSKVTNQPLFGELLGSALYEH
jgi:DNA-binding NtrC family response regulator